MRYLMISLLLIVLTSITVVSVQAQTSTSPSSNSTAFVDMTKVGPYLKQYSADGKQFNAGFVPYATKIVSGAPVIVTFTLINTDKVRYTIPRISPRGLDTNYVFEVTNNLGVEIKPSKGSGRGGELWCSVLTPNETFFDPIRVSDYIQPLEPGSYEVVCIRRKILPLADPQMPEIRTKFTLTVLQSDSGRLGEKITNLGSIIETSSGLDKQLGRLISRPDLQTATESLALIDDMRIVPYLLKSVGKGEYYNINPALKGLGKYPSEDLIPVILEKLHDTHDGSLRYSAASALGSFKFPVVVDALCNALTDTDIGVRQSALKSLASIGDKRAIKDMKPLLEDPNPLVIKNAIDALVKLGEAPEPAWFDPLYSDTMGLQHDNAGWMISRLLGRKGLPYLASKLDLNSPGMKNYRNYALINRISSISGEKFTYLHDFDNNGTSEEQAQNLAVMKEVQSRFE